MRRRGLVVVAVAAAAVALVSWRARPRTGSLTASWPAGERSVYSFAWQAQSEARPIEDQPGAAMSIDLAGELVVRALGEHDGVTHLGIALGKIDRGRMTLLERTVPADKLPSLLNGHEAFVDVDARGRVASLQLAASDPALAKIVLTDLIELMQVTLPERAGESWDAVEERPLGRAQAHYSRRGRSITRHDVGYERLASAPPESEAIVRASQAEISVDERGRTVELDDEVRVEGRKQGRTLVTGSSRFVLSRLRVERDERDYLAAPAVATLETHRPGEPAVARPSQDDRLRAWAGQTRLADVMVGIGAFARGHKPAKDWILRASAFLALHPEAVAQVRALLDDPALDGRGHELAMDLLAATGTPAAQAAMRDAVESGALARDPNVAQLIQRFGQLAHPEPRSIELLWTLHARDRESDLGTAATFAFGSMARRLAGTPDGAAYRGRLERELGAAKTAAARATLVSALGNASAPSSVLAPLARDESAKVRAETAIALRWQTDSVAQATLVELAGDDDAIVDRAALSSLARHPLAPAQVAGLRASLDAGRLRPEVDSALLTLLADNTSAGADVETMLRTIGMRAQDPMQRGRVQMVLWQMQRPH